MARKQREPTRPRSTRFPLRLWLLAEQAANDLDISVNQLLWRLLEDYLVKRGHLKQGDRKRGTLPGAPKKEIRVREIQPRKHTPPGKPARVVPTSKDGIFWEKTQ